ncbi:hypothetical protein [Streptomyces sp. NPDC001089]
MYLLRLPGDFVPEDHGWSLRNPIVPHQQLQAAMAELHRWGFVSRHYVRPADGSEFPASLAVTGYDSTTREYLCMYLPPSGCREREVTAAQMWDEIRGGVGRTGVSGGK